MVKLLNNKGLIQIDNDRINVVYARVSTSKQKNRGDLDRQVESIYSSIVFKNPKNLLTFKEVGSGLNDNRKELLKLSNLVMNDKIDRIFILYKDRFTRFEFNYLKSLCDFHNTEIIILSDEIKDKSIEEELAEDIIAIIHSFSGKLYGLRNRLKKRTRKGVK